MDHFSVGDTVAWNTPYGLHTGTVLERHDEDFALPRQRMTASPAHPVYEVESHTTGGRGGHPPETLQHASQTAADGLE